MKRTGFKNKIRKPLKITAFKRSVKSKTLPKSKDNPKKVISKVKSKKTLHKALWKLFSKYIRERDNYVCFTCGKKTWPAQAGHYRTGATCKKYLFFDERNVHCQCYHCNINLSGNWYEYRKRILSLYGDGIDHEFDVINQKDGWDYPYEEKIEYYKSL